MGGAKCCISHNKTYILCIIIDQSQPNKIIVDKYYKSSNEYKRVSITPQKRLDNIEFVILDEKIKKLLIFAKVFSHVHYGTTQIWAISLDIDTHKLMNQHLCNMNVDENVHGDGTYHYEKSMHLLKFLSEHEKLKYYIHDIIAYNYGPHAFNIWKRIIFDDENGIIYVSDLKKNKKIYMVQIGDNNEFEWIDDEISHPPNLKFISDHAYSIIYVYQRLIILIFNDLSNSDIWCLDLRNKKWFKSEYLMPFTVRWNVVNGEDNYLYFICYKDSRRQIGYRCNFKISLFDIIPWEIYQINKDQNMILIHGFINDIAKQIDLICPDSLINVILLYYPPFLYV